MVRPADLCSQWLHFLGIGPQHREPSHVEQVAPGKPSRRTCIRAKVLCDPPDDVIAPAAGLLLREDLTPDRPVEHDQLRVQGAGGASLRLADLDAEALDQFTVGSARGDSVHIGHAIPHGMPAHRTTSVPT